MLNHIIIVGLLFSCGAVADQSFRSFNSSPGNFSALDKVAVEGSSKKLFNELDQIEIQQAFVPKDLDGSRELSGNETRSAIFSLQQELQETRTLLSEEISLLKKQLEEAKGSFAAQRAGYVTLNDGWVGMFNGYQYKVFLTRQTHGKSKYMCRQLGGQVVVHGIQDMTNRKILQRALNLRSFGGWFWIGLSAIRTEGQWEWEDRVPATDATALWFPGQPDGGAGEDCTYMHSYHLLSHDVQCRYKLRAICEKPWMN